MTNVYIQEFHSLLGNLGSDGLKDRAHGSRRLRSLVARNSGRLSSCDHNSMLARLAEFSQGRAVKSKSRDRLVGIGLLRAIFQVNVYHAVESRVGALNVLFDVLEANRASDYDAQSVSTAASILGWLAVTAILKPEFELLAGRYLEPAIDWLIDPRYEIRRYAGALIVSQLISTVPTIIFSRRDLIIERLWLALVDRTRVVREAASLATIDLLQVSCKRLPDANETQMHYRAAANFISRGLLGCDVSDYQVHAAMLLLRMLSKRASTELIWKYKVSSKSIKSWQMLGLSDTEKRLWCFAVIGTRGVGAKDPSVREIALEITPFLAQLICEKLFSRLGAANSILNTLKFGTESRVGYIALGRISIVAASSILCSADGLLVISNITRSVACRLQEVNKKSYCYNEIVLCLAMLVRGACYFTLEIKKRMAWQIRSSIAYIFDNGVTPSVIYTITTIFEALPNLSSVLQHHVFAELLALIRCVPVKTLKFGAILPLALQHKKRPMSRLEVMGKHSRFCLSNSMAFRFINVLERSIGHHMYCAQSMTLVASTIINYAELPDTALRYETIVLCCQCLDRVVCSSTIISTYDIALGTIIEHLIMFALSDECAQIRSIIISKLSRVHIAATTMLPRLAYVFHLFAGLSNMRVQQAALRSLAKLTLYDSFRVSPFLINLFGALIPQFRVATSSFSGRYFLRFKKEMRILTLLHAHSILAVGGCVFGQFATALVLPTLEVFQAAISCDVAVIAAGILGDLATLAETTSLASIEGAIPRMVDLLCSMPPAFASGFNIARTFMRALSQIINSTGAVVVPVCWRDGELFDMLWKQNNRISLKSDCSALLGSIGAISPQILGHLRHTRTTLSSLNMVVKRHNTIQECTINQDAESGLSNNKWGTSAGASLSDGKVPFNHGSSQQAFFCSTKMRSCIISIADTAFSKHRVLSTEEHSQITSLSTVLGVLKGFPELKREALTALVQTCRSFRRAALPLYTALRIMLGMLGVCGDVNISANRLLKVKFGSDIIDTANEMLLHCATQVLYYTATNITTIVCSSHVTCGLSLHWSHSAPGRGGIAALTYALSKKMSPHAFSTLLISFLPSMLIQLPLSPFRILRSLDLLDSKIVSSGQTPEVLSCFMSYLSITQSYEHPGAQCLTIIGAIRLINRTTCVSVLHKILPSFVLKLITLINPDNTIQLHETHEFINDMFLFLEIAVVGLVSACRQLGLRFVPYMSTINIYLVGWIRMLDNTAGFSRSPLAESILVCSTIRTLPATRIHGVTLAIAEYCGAVNAILRGARFNSLSARLLYVLCGEYDEVVIDMVAVGLSTIRGVKSEEVPLILAPDNHQVFQETLIMKALATPEDWMEWIRHVSVEVLRQSYLPHLRACASICEIHQPSAFQLFRSAILSSLHAGNNSNLANMILSGLTLALHVEAFPADSIVMILDLALFMNAHNSPLPLDFSRLARRVSGPYVAAALLESNKVTNPANYTAEINDTCLHFDLHSDSDQTVHHSLKLHQTCFQTEFGVIHLRSCSAVLDFHGLLDSARLLWYRLKCSSKYCGKSCIASPQQGNDLCKTWASAAAAKAGWLQVNMLHEIATLGIQAAWMLQQWDDMENFVSFWGKINLKSINCLCRPPSICDHNICLICLSATAARTHDKPHELLLYHAVLTLRNDDPNRTDYLYSGSILDAHCFMRAARLSFLRSYSHLDSDQIFFLQRLQEMQEVVDYLALPIALKETARVSLCNKWLRQIRWWAHPDPHLWSQLMMVRNLIYTQVDTHMMLSVLCQDAGRMLDCFSMLGRLRPLLRHLSPFYCQAHFAARQENQLLNLTPNMLEFLYQRNIRRRDIPRKCVFVHYRICLLIWEIGDCKSAYHYLFSLSRTLLGSQKASRNKHHINIPLKKLLLSCLTTRSEWCVALTKVGSWTEHYNSLNEARSLMAFAIELGPCTSQAWLVWALTNYELCEHVQRSSLKCRNKQMPIQIHFDNLVHYVIGSIDGFFRSIDLFDNNHTARNDAVVIQAMLMIITLWFKYGSRGAVDFAVEYGLAKSSVGIWLGVLPQLIARLDHGDSNSRSLLTYLLTRIGHVHPQALIYPLTISGKSLEVSRRDASILILCNLQDSIPVNALNKALVAEAGLIACELHRAAITWHEAWFQGIENAANIYFGDGNIKTMVTHLAALHSCWQQEISTESLASPVSNKQADVARVMAFRHTYGCDVEEARRCISQFVRSHSVKDLNQAWDLYSALHRRLKTQLSSAGCETVKLCHIAPKLLSVQNLSLAVPGTYNSAADRCRIVCMQDSPQRDIVRITSFCLQANIICSKQRPRRIKMHGSNGISYDFLLKGNEDLRQDERVMQLCGLINCLLAKADRKLEPTQKLLQVTRYAVMPLSNNSGLIEWLSDCCTIHSLIVEYRARFSIQADAELRCAEAVAPDYLGLMCLGKVDAFSYSLARTKGTDLASMLWLSSEDTNKWLCTRQMFTLTLGLTSMVGYIVGLGDRHMSNIMVNILTGDVIHIDFGDCFDVALERDIFPEYVPFRLTRQLINVMEVGGVGRSFRLVCNHAMTVMRIDYRSLTTMLEALVHDPVIGLYSISTSLKPARRFDSLVGASCQATHKNQQAAIRVIDLIHNKLVGRDAVYSRVTLIEDQVSKLVRQAQAHMNICQMFFGWCPFW